MDLTGIDLAYTMGMEAFRNSGDRADLPVPSLVKHFVNGEYGQKTGRGWYDYKE
jgi:3-hydroxybutyryl-CoA dehydrogenase